MKEYDMFSPQSEVILFRQVVNDAVVEPWQELKDAGEPTLNGLKKWMRSQIDEAWHPENLNCVVFSQNRNLWDYGLRLQFWVPFPDNVPKPVVLVCESRPVTLVCKDAFGLDDITESKRYVGEKREDGLYEVEDDVGEKKLFFADRFEVVSSGDMNRAES